MTMKRGEVLKLPVKRKRVRAVMSPELARAVIPTEVRPGVMLAAVSGHLLLSDNTYKVEVSMRFTFRRKMRKLSPINPMFLGFLFHIM